MSGRIRIRRLRANVPLQEIKVRRMVALGVVRRKHQDLEKMMVLRLCGPLVQKIKEVDVKEEEMGREKRTAGTLIRVGLDVMTAKRTDLDVAGKREMRLN